MSAISPSRSAAEISTGRRGQTGCIMNFKMLPVSGNHKQNQFLVVAERLQSKLNEACRGGK
jgi:hypothetical protein